jgi:hypothetical protein
MAISKNYLKTKPVCKITFEVPSEAETLSVVGDFNNWDLQSTQLKKLKNGKFKGKSTLKKENSMNSNTFQMGPIILMTNKQMHISLMIMLVLKMEY